MAIQLVISGCCGRMGKTIARCALADPTFEIRAALEAPGSLDIGDYSKVLGQPLPRDITVINVPAVAIPDRNQIPDQQVVLIEFTTPEATVEHAQLARTRNVPMVVGTTGLSQAQQAVLREAAKTIPIVFSPNMSPGVTVLFELAQLAAQRLGQTYDVEVVEAHHRHKKDQPSGTAKRLAEELAAARGQSVASIPVHALRAGDIVGDHTVVLAGPSERLELTHRAHSRDVFAQGVLRAARFVVSQPPGLYDMSHVLKTVGG